MTGIDHAAEVERLLASLPTHGLNAATGFDRGEQIAVAQAHATLEQAKWLHEIADQLDVLPRRVGARCDEVDGYGARCRLRYNHDGHHKIGINRERFPLHDAAEILEGLAIGDELPAREMTIARLVLHQVMPYPDAEQIAGDARLLAHESRDPWRLDEVNTAIALLKIDIPVIDAEVDDE